MFSRYLFVFGILVFLFVPFILAESETDLNVPNSPPYFVGLIPNFSFSDGYLENAFDLDDYFFDLQDDLNYFANTTTLDVVIDSNNSVSFYSLEGYESGGTVVFTGSDGEYNVSSNKVYLGGGTDTLPPFWFNPRKDSDEVFQGSNLTFSADWEDNFGLSSYYLSINEVGTWEEYYGNFSGRENVSRNTISVGAPAGKYVEWKICGFDTSMNENCTDVYNFTVSYPPASPPSEDGDYEGEEGEAPVKGEGIKDLYEDMKDLVGSEEITDFSIDVESFLVELKQGTSLTRSFEIINSGTNSLPFSVSVEGAEDFIVFDDREFSLDSGESKAISIDFKTNLMSQPGQYFANIVIEGPETIVIPIVINVNEVDLDFEVTVEVLEEYENVKPGKKVFANINITNKGDAVSSDSKFIISIKDFYGNIYDTSEEVVTFDKGLALERNLTVPEDVLLGKYIFHASVSNEKDIAISSDVFVVGLSFVFEAFLKSSSVFIVIFLLSVISIVLSFRYKKQKLKERALNLYVKLHEMKELIKEGDYEGAASAYISIKKIYGEKVSTDVLKNKEKLSEAIEKLAKDIDFEEVKKESNEEKEEGSESEENKEKENASDSEDVKAEDKNSKEKNEVQKAEEKNEKESEDDEEKKETSDSEKEVKKTEEKKEVKETEKKPQKESPGKEIQEENADSNDDMKNSEEKEKSESLEKEKEKSKKKEQVKENAPIEDEAKKSDKKNVKKETVDKKNKESKNREDIRKKLRERLSKKNEK